MDRRTLILTGGSAMALAGCGGSWEVAYDEGIPAHISREWHVHSVRITVPDSLTVSNRNSLAPNADIVWHGEPYGDRRAQVKTILQEGIDNAAKALTGPISTYLVVDLLHFHAVTPAAVSRAPSAVHNINFGIQVRNNETNRAITKRHVIQADLEAFVGASAVTAAIQGDTQRVRIVRHIEAVTRSWLGIGPDQRREFGGIGR